MKELEENILIVFVGKKRWSMLASLISHCILRDKYEDRVFSWDMTWWPVNENWKREAAERPGKLVWGLKVDGWIYFDGEEWSGTETEGNICQRDGKTQKCNKLHWKPSWGLLSNWNTGRVDRKKRACSWTVQNVRTECFVYLDWLIWVIYFKAWRLCTCLCYYSV